MVKSIIIFDAPWGVSLKLITIFSISILVGLPIIGLLNSAGNGIIWFISMVILPLIILISATFFMVRGYELTKDKLFIQRLGWKSGLNLNELQSVEVDPEAMKRSIRTFGNGGLFCYVGKFRNKKLGSYRAFATDPELAVVLKFTDKVVIVTPDNPGKFVAQIKSLN